MPLVGSTPSGLNDNEVSRDAEKIKLCRLAVNETAPSIHAALAGDRQAQEAYLASRAISLSSLPLRVLDYLMEHAKRFYHNVSPRDCVKWDREVVMRLCPVQGLKLGNDPASVYERPEFTMATFAELGIEKAGTLENLARVASDPRDPPDPATGRRATDFILTRDRAGRARTIEERGAALAEFPPHQRFVVRQSFDPTLNRPDGYGAYLALRSLVPLVTRAFVLMDFLAKERLDISPELQVKIFGKSRDPWDLLRQSEVRSLLALRDAIETSSLPSCDRSFIFETFATGPRPVDSAIDYFKSRADIAKRRADPPTVESKPSAQITRNTTSPEASLRSVQNDYLSGLRQAGYEGDLKDYARRLRSLVQKGLATDADVRAGIQEKIPFEQLIGQLRSGSFIPSKSTPPPATQMSDREAARLRARLFPEEQSLDQKIDVATYSSPDDRDSFAHWLHELDNSVRSRVIAHIDRIPDGGLGKVKPL